jgi:RNA polymerase sigma factor (sigma-70 family)
MHEVLRALEEARPNRPAIEPAHRRADARVSPAAEELVRRQYAAVYNLAYRALPRREDAEGIAQQTFALAAARLERLSDPAVAGAWLYRLAGELCFKEVRRRRRRGIWTGPDAAAWAAATSGDSPGASGAPGERDLRLKVMQAVMSLSAEQRLALAPHGLDGVGYEKLAEALRLKAWQVMLALPPEQRLALALRELDGVRYADLAAALHTRAASVKTLLFQARRALHRAYGGSQKPEACDAACARVQEWLSAAIDGELGPADQARTDLHRAVCQSCDVAARELRAVSQLHALAPVVSPPAGAQAAALAALPGGAGKAARRIPAVGRVRLGLAAAAVLVLGAGVVWTARLPSSLASTPAPRPAMPARLEAPRQDLLVPTAIPTATTIPTAIPTVKPTPTASVATATAVPATAVPTTAPTPAPTVAAVVAAPPAPAAELNRPAPGTTGAADSPTPLPALAAEGEDPAPLATEEAPPGMEEVQPITEEAEPVTEGAAEAPGELPETPEEAPEEVSEAPQEAPSFTSSVALRVHSSPSVGSPVVSGVRAATALQVLEGPIRTASGNFYRVRLPDGSEGYVAPVPRDLPRALTGPVSR